MHLQKIAIVAAALSMAACAHKQAVASAEEPPAAPMAESTPAPEVAAPMPPMACTGDEQCSSGQLCVASACTPITPSLAECSLARVHFDFDQDLVHPDEAPILARMARCIEASEPTHVLIVGGADERGTVEYNLALGQRRADAVRRYLANLGVAARKLELVSYGKELPLCTEHDEACWQQNRRASIRPGAEPKDLSAILKRDEARERAGSAGGE